MKKPTKEEGVSSNTSFPNIFNKPRGVGVITIEKKDVLKSFQILLEHFCQL